MGGELVASRSYTPEETASFDESWRWTELEALSPYRVRQVDRRGDGPLWFAVHGGIVEFDGYVAKPYWFEDAGFEEANGLSILVASDGAIYVLANRYLARFKEGEWFQYPGIWRNASSGSSLAESVDGTVWVVSRTGPPKERNAPLGGNLILYRVNGNDVSEVDLDGAGVSGLIVDRQNRLWLSSSETGEITRYALNRVNGNWVGEPWRIPTGKYNRIKAAVTEFHEGPSGRMWVATNSDESAIRSVEGDVVTTTLANWGEFGPANRLLTEMPDGSLWVVSTRVMAKYSNRNWQLKRMDSQVNWFTFLHNFDNEYFITGGHTDKTYAFDVSESRWKTHPGLNYGCQAADGSLWFLSEDKRIVHWDKVVGSWTSYGVEDGLMDQPNAMIAAKEGRIWASGSHQGVAAVAWLEGSRWVLDAHPNFSDTICHISVFQSEQGELYFGSNTPLLQIPGKTGGVLRYWESEAGPTYEYLGFPEFPEVSFGIAQQPNGNLWIGGRSLTRKRPGEPFERIAAFRSDVVDNVVVDARGSLWVGDWRSGVSRMNGGRWERMSISKGRTRDQLVSLLASRNSPVVWAATTDLLGRYDGNSWSVHTRFPELMLQREGARLHESLDGRVWINSAARSWNFNSEPEEVEKPVEFKTLVYHPDDAPPETRIELFEETLPESGNAYFEWSGVDAWSQTWSVDLEYSYRINGGEWSPYSKETQASIPSLAPGRYRLDVRARDTDWNVDPSPAVAEFSVIPFVWKRPWFLATVFLGVCVIGFLIYLLVRTRVKHILALEEFKLDFFTNISHELRTPLSVIMGPLERIMKRVTDDDVKSDADMAFRNVRKMKGLVDQLLEFRKVELGKLEYKPVRSDIILFIKDAVYAHASLWEKKEQAFHMTCDEEHLICRFDPDKLQHMLSNLLSNAIKYTHPKGEIGVRVGIDREESEQEDRATLTIEVTDTGIGIEASRQELIFKPFYRAQDTVRDSEGSGIGLAYTYELAKLWGGDISVESPVRGSGSNLGSQFTLRLPLDGLGEGGLDVDAVSISELNTEREPALETGGDWDLERESVSDSPDCPRLLVVEDNSDVLEYLRKELSPGYEVTTATNGQEGLDEAGRRMPDVVVADLMMPVMDGLEMCSRLKLSPETCHIPVLILTARGSDEFRLKGIENGADDYFSKPVNMELLKARIENALETRRALRERFARQIVVEPSEIAVTPVDEQILEKAIAVVEEHMSEETFDVEIFAKEMAMSRGSLYKKLKAILDMAPSMFIRSLRLKRAAQLLQSSQMNVSDLSYSVGIKELSYFSKIFRDEYGCSPSEYRARCAKTEDAIPAK